MLQHLARLARPFSSRNYRLYFGGQVVSLTGTWMTQTASLWVTYHLTRSPFWLGIVGFATLAPMLFLGPVAGVWVDRVNRYRLLLLTQALSMIQSLTLAWLTLRGTLTIEELVLLSAVQGVITAFDLPARQAMVVQYIDDPEHLGGAIALNSFMFNLTRMIGPALAGWIIARSGAGGCFLIDGLSYLAVLAALGAMRLPPLPPPKPRRHPWHEFADGLRYAFGAGPIRFLLLTASLSSFCFYPVMTLAPVFAKEVYHGDARTLGLLMSALGLGATLSGVYLGMRSASRGLDRNIVTGMTLAGIGLIVAASVPYLDLVLPFLCLAGAGGILVFVSCNILLQTLVEDGMRGRVMSLFTLPFGMSLGNLAFGTLAEHWGAPLAVRLSGLLALAVSLLFAWKLPRMRD